MAPSAPRDANPWSGPGPRATALLALAALACSPGAPDRPSLLLITLDTTRVEALGVYGGRKGVTPFLDALAAESLVYEAARTVAPITLPAHASMLTGLYPPRHGLVDNGLAALPQAASTLAERAREQGLASAAFVSAVVLDRSFGLDQGFEVYDTPNARRKGSSHAERSAQATLAAAGEWLAQRDRSQAFLLWAHLFDPHMPYAPDERFLRQAKGNAYLGEVAAMDAAIGELLAGLREDGTLASTVVVIVADHGESLGQHGERTHGAFVYDSTMKVPLLVRYPDGWGAGRRSREIVSVVDLFPTLCEGLELGPPGAVDGLSLWRRSVPEGRGVYFESYNGFLNYGWSPLAGWVDGAGKYVHSPSPEFYEPHRDRLEERDLAAERDDLQRYRDGIASVFARPRLHTESGDEVAGSLIEGLVSLGYTGAAAPAAGLPDPLADSGLPAPRERTDELERFWNALAMHDRGHDHGGAEESIAALSAVVRDYPRNTIARQFLSTWLVQAGRFDEARRLLEELIEAGAARSSQHANLGLCLEQAGELERAASSFQRAVELDPSNGFALEHLAASLETLGRTPEADAVRARRAELHLR